MSNKDSDDVPRSKKAGSESPFVITETIGTIDNAQDLLTREVTKKEEGIFGLPIEVRLQIYEYVVPSLCLEPIRRHSKFYNKRTDPNHRLSNYNALTAVCRQSYADTVGSALLYKVAHFHFDSPGAMYDYLEIITPARKNAIRSIYLRFGLERIRPDVSYSLSETHALESLRSFESLRKLTLTVSLQGPATYEWRACLYCGVWHLWNVTSIPDEALAKIKDTAWAAGVHGLKLFKLCLDIRYMGGPNRTLTVWGSHGLTHDQRYHALEKELRGIFRKQAR